MDTVKSEVKKPSLQLKATCCRCKVNKWCVDFKEGCAANITSKSICLFCELREKIESQQREIEELRKELEKLSGKRETGNALGGGDNCSGAELSNIVSEISNMKTSIKGLIDSSTETGVGLVEVRNQLAEMETQNTDGFTRVSGRRAAKPKSSFKKETSFTCSTSNRFALLATEEEETFLVGDSMVTDQGRCFGKGNKGKRKVRSFPGANTKKIGEEVKKMKVKSKKSSIIVHVGSNDLYLRNGKVGQTEKIVEELEDVVNSIASKTDNGMLVGIFPRLNASYYALSKAIGINDRIEVICKRKGVRFLNFWDKFVTNRNFFRGDGVHFNEKGKTLFGDLLHKNVFSQMKSSVRNDEQQQQSVLQPEQQSSTSGKQGN